MAESLHALMARARALRAEHAAFASMTPLGGMSESKTSDTATRPKEAALPTLTATAETAAPADPAAGDNPAVRRREICRLLVMRIEALVSVLANNAPMNAALVAYNAELQARCALGRERIRVELKDGATMPTIEEEDHPSFVEDAVFVTEPNAAYDKEVFDTWADGFVRRVEEEVFSADLRNALINRDAAAILATPHPVLQAIDARALFEDQDKAGQDWILERLKLIAQLLLSAKVYEMTQTSSVMKRLNVVVQDVLDKVVADSATSRVASAGFGSSVAARMAAGSMGASGAGELLSGAAEESNVDPSELILGVLEEMPRFKQVMDGLTPEETAEFMSIVGTGDPRNLLDAMVPGLSSQLEGFAGPEMLAQMGSMMGSVGGGVGGGGGGGGAAGLASLMASLGGLGGASGTGGGADDGDSSTADTAEDAGGAGGSVNVSSIVNAMCRGFLKNDFVGQFGGLMGAASLPPSAPAIEDLD
jgi:hypothetical protein